jgi:hypothetical protein
MKDVLISEGNDPRHMFDRAAERLLTCVQIALKVFADLCRRDWCGINYVVHAFEGFSGVIRYLTLYRPASMLPVDPALHPDRDVGPPPYSQHRAHHIVVTWTV